MEFRFKCQVRYAYHLSFHLFIDAIKAQEVSEWSPCILNLFLQHQMYVHREPETKIMALYPTNVDYLVSVCCQHTKVLISVSIHMDRACGWCPTFAIF